jgi:hypothetical protein
MVFKRCKGYKQVTHTGGLEGIVTQTTYIPELQLGIIVLTNQLALHLMLLQTRSRTVTWESLQRMLVFIVIKANEETADKTTDEVWATIAKK